MGIEAIDTKSPLRVTNKELKISSASQDFSVFMGSLNPGVGQMGTLGVDPNATTVSQATVTGLSGASATAAAAPYYGSYAPGMASIATGPTTFGPDYAAPAVGPGSTAVPVSTTGSDPAAGGSPFSNPSQDFLEKDFLLQKMNDSAMNMLVLQARVQDDNRKITLVSGLVQARHNTEREMIQHIGRT